MGKTNLHVTAFNANGDVLARLRGFDISPDLSTEDGKGMAQRFSKHIPTKREVKVMATLIHYVSTNPGTMLNIDVFSFDGSSQLGRLKSGTLSITNANVDTSGGADGDKSPNEGGTDIALEGEFVITSTAALVGALLTEDPEDWIGNLVGTIIVSEGGTVLFQAPMLLSGGVHSATDRAAQIEKATWKLHGTVTTPSSDASTSIFAAAVYDPDSLSFYATSGANAYASSGTPDTGVIESAEVTWNDGAITEEKYTFAIEGTLAVT